MRHHLRTPARESIHVLLDASWPIPARAREKNTWIRSIVIVGSDFVLRSEIMEIERERPGGSEINKLDSYIPRRESLGNIRLRLVDARDKPSVNSR